VARLDKEVTIEAPLENIFRYISNPSNMPEIWPSLIEVKGVQPLSNGGYSFQWVYKMAGMRFKGEGEYTVMDPNRFFVINTRGGIVSMIAWTTRSKENLTRVTFTVEYVVPVPLLGKLAEIIITKMNEQEGDLIMANLQARFTPTN